MVFKLKIYHSWWIKKIYRYNFPKTNEILMTHCVMPSVFKPILLKLPLLWGVPLDKTNSYQILKFLARIWENLTKTLSKSKRKFLIALSKNLFKSWHSHHPNVDCSCASIYGPTLGILFVTPSDLHISAWLLQMSLPIYSTSV